MKKITKKFELGGRELTLSMGELAGQADAAVLAQYGETVVFASVVAAPLTQDLDYFPLSVEYQEKLYAGGRIKGSRWVKREGRPTDEEILNARLIDRSIRPLFPKSYKRDVQVIVMVLSVDMENDPADIAPIAVSAALSASRIPWGGPAAAMRVGLKDGKYLINPKAEENSEMDLVVASTKEAVVMIEAGANEVSEKDILGGIKFAQKESKVILDAIDEFAKKAGNKKEKFEEHKTDKKLVAKVEKLAAKKIDSIIESLASKEGHNNDLDDLVSEVKEQVEEDEQKEVFEIIDHQIKMRIREMILKGKRPDGRKHTDIRPLSSRVGVLPRTHGSAIFQRGTTQVLTVATLGTAQMGLLIETAEGEEEKRYIHHYSMPPYSTGETGRVGSPKRREIGHGALAERALLPVIPENGDFPYTIRVVSEVMSSNGSTSMASTCGSTLSLMDAGVPIKAPVSGIAMGLVVEDEKNYAILSDIMGIEDFNGDMDFKVTGTEKGITALQLDVKTLQLTSALLEKAVEWVEGMVKVPEPGEIYEGTVRRLQPFGAFVEILPGQDGLVHVRDMAEEYVNDPADIVSEGDKVQVRVKEIDNMGRLNLSMILDPSKEKPQEPREQRSNGDRGGFRGNRGGRGYNPERSRRGGRRDNNRGGGRRDNNRGGSGGPHFPASRLVSQDKKRFSR